MMVNLSEVEVGQLVGVILMPFELNDKLVMITIYFRL